MDTGFITLHRKIKDNEIWKNPDLAHLFTHLLLSANHDVKKFLFNGKVETVGRGQLITGRKVLSQETGINESKIVRLLKILQNLEIIDTQPNNRFSLITIVKYSDYQDKREKVNSQTRSRRTTSEQQVNTNNNVNNDNKENNITAETAGVNKLFDILYKVNPGINYARKDSRDAAQWMIKKFGQEKAEKLAEAAEAIQGKEFAPSIKTPKQLKEKLGELNDYFKRQNNNKSNVIII